MILKIIFSNHESENKIQYNFSFTKAQENSREHLFSQYGKNINGLSKIVTRISNLESQFRKLNTKDGTDLRDIYKKTGESFTKYALSN